MIKVLYPCDPSKNTKCTKEACQSMCTMTTDPTCAKDNWAFKDLKVVPSRNMDLKDILFINMLKQEGEKHDKIRNK